MNMFILGEMQTTKIYGDYLSSGQSDCVHPWLLIQATGYESLRTTREEKKYARQKGKTRASNPTWYDCPRRYGVTVLRSITRALRHSPKGLRPQIWLHGRVH